MTKCSNSARLIRWLNEGVTLKIRLHSFQYKNMNYALSFTSTNIQITFSHIESSNNVYILQTFALFLVLLTVFFYCFL